MEFLIHYAVRKNDTASLNRAILLSYLLLPPDWPGAIVRDSCFPSWMTRRNDQEIIVEPFLCRIYVLQRNERPLFDYLTWFELPAGANLRRLTPVITAEWLDLGGLYLPGKRTNLLE